MRNIIILLCLSFTIYNTKAQKTAENQLGTWYMYNGSHKISDKIVLKTMAHFRYFELASEFQQEIYRLGINYAFTSKTNITLGVSYASGDLTYKALAPNLYESRFYEDLNLKWKWKKITTKHRFRLEQRFIHKNNIINEFQSWLRYDLNVEYPLSKAWNVYAFNELFLILNNPKTFVQNWTGAGFLYKLNNNVKLKAGYFQIKTSTVVFKRLQLGVIINTDFSKKRN